MKVGQKLFELRRQKNLSQEEVANLLNVSRQTISKWETDQSTPDFDKIVPLCELYQITTDELLTGKKVIKENTKPESRGKMILILIGSIFLYFVSISWVAFGEETLAINEGILVSVFLLLLGIATSMLVYYFISTPKAEIKNVQKIQKRENKIVKQINEILAILTTIIYLLISFITSAWHITWVIWIIYALLEEIIKLIFMLKEAHYES